MKSILLKLAVIFIIFIFLGLIGQIFTSSDRASDKELSPIIGNVENLKSSYDIWKFNAAKNGAENKITMGLGYSKALSFDVTTARGKATLDLITGAFSVEVSGLNEDENYDVWLIDNIDGPKKSVKPEEGDLIVKLGSLNNNDGSLKLYTQIDPKKFSNFKLDLVAVTPAGKGPIDSGLLFASPSLFQRLYYSELRGEIANLTTTLVISGKGNVFSAPFSILIPGPAIAEGVGLTPLEKLLAEGEDLFFEETFDGNGRTCGTCHPMENNLTIDPDFIATLPDDDPLFVAEFNPDLSENFEKPELMRQFGLILENVDGFGNLENRFVMRGVPHTLALITSIEQASNLPANEPHPAEMTGWSGDGAPGGGALRDFPTGAVTQHFTKTLNRVPGTDFRLPNDHELDAMEAFQLSLGRQGDPDLTTLQLTNASAQNGLVIFRDGNNPTNDPTKAGGRCNTCHGNAGANNASGENRNFNTGVEDLQNNPAKLFDPTIPRDGGFGTVNRNPAACTTAPSPDCGFGDGRFNATTVIEAADTGPFFHNNAVETIEEAVEFFNGPEFNENPNNPRALSAQINLSDQEGDDVANFLRVGSALENIRNSNEFLHGALSETKFGRAKKKLRIALADIEDAIQLLVEKGLNPTAVTDLDEAVGFAQTASNTNSTGARNNLINSAINELTSARNDMCTAGSDAVLCP